MGSRRLALMLAVAFLVAAWQPLAALVQAAMLSPTPSTSTADVADPSPTWRLLYPGTPAQRSGHTVIFDAGDLERPSQLVLFGGSLACCGDSSQLTNETWLLPLDAIRGWTRAHTFGSFPPVRTEHSAIADRGHQRMIVFGGLGWDGNPLNDVWALDLTGTPTWSQLTISGTVPPARSGHTAIWDSQNDRMIIFGGLGKQQVAPGVFEPVNYNDVWALSLSGTPTWTQISAGEGPLGRSEHSAIYDIRNGQAQMIVFGGVWTSVGGSSSFGDVWSLSLSGTPTWTEIRPANDGPMARHSHLAVLDTDRQQMVVYGGINATDYRPDTPLYDVWSLSLADTPTWTQLAPTGGDPWTRWNHAGVYDPHTESLLVFGGLTTIPGTAAVAPANDVWSLSLATGPAWSRLLPDGLVPNPRSSHAAVYDPVGQRMLVHGGLGCSSAGIGNPVCEDTWALSLDGTPRWQRIVAINTGPTRFGYSAIFDTANNRLVFFAGQPSNTPSYATARDVWALSLSGTPTWSEITPAVPGAVGRSRHSAVYDPVNQRMIIFGGITPVYDMERGMIVAKTLNDVWSLSLVGTPVWTELTPTGPAPSPRYGHFAAFDAAQQRMFVFGGEFIGGSTTDVWVLSLAGTPTWSQLTPIGTPPIGSPMVAVFDEANQRIVVLVVEPGSITGIPTAYQLTLSGEPAWSLLPRIGDAPPYASAGTAIYDPQGQQLVVFGGDQFSNAVWSLSLPTEGSPSPTPTATATPTVENTATSTPAATTTPTITPTVTPTPANSATATAVAATATATAVATRPPRTDNQVYLPAVLAQQEPPAGS